MTASFYKMARGWMANPAFRPEPYTDREAWVWLIEAASYADREWRIGSRIVTLRRGQICHSLRYLGGAWGWGKNRVARYLARLESLNMICSENGPESGTAEKVISLCNYDRYQATPAECGTGSGTRPGHDRDKTKEINTSFLTGRPSAEVIPLPLQSQEPAGQGETPKAIDLGAIVYREGRTLLAGAPLCMSATAAGALLTKWRRDVGDDAALLTILASASKADRDNLRAYITAAVQSHKNGGRRPAPRPQPKHGGLSYD